MLNAIFALRLPNQRDINLRKKIENIKIFKYFKLVNLVLKWLSSPHPLFL